MEKKLGLVTDGHRAHVFKVAVTSAAELNTPALKHSDELFCKKNTKHLEQHFDKYHFNEISFVAALA